MTGDPTSVTMYRRFTPEQQAIIKAAYAALDALPADDEDPETAAWMRWDAGEREHPEGSLISEYPPEVNTTW